MTDMQRQLARHALGLPNRTKCSYRNRFIAGEGHSDYAEWMLMVEAGYATREEFGSHPSTHFLFFLTGAGAVLALNSREKLDREDFPVITKAEDQERKRLRKENREAAKAFSV